MEEGYMNLIRKPEQKTQKNFLKRTSVENVQRNNVIYIDLLEQVS
jgi:hypothetical protein